jgi:glycerophosphoryl diester phosphodiesterase
MPALFAALVAMAGIRWRQIPFDFESDVAAKARTLVHDHFSFLLPALDNQSIDIRQSLVQEERMKRRGIALLSLIAAAGAIALLPGYGPAAHPFFAGLPDGKVEIMAHGAGQGVAPTNTLRALKTAAAQGADVLEIDVQLTRDGVLVLHHDDTLDRTTDMTGPVAAKTWAQIAAEDKGATTTLEGVTFSGDDTKVARLDTALAAFPGARWNIEIKNDSTRAADQLCAAIKAANLQDKVLVASFHDDALAHFRAICPRVATSMGPSEIRAFVIASHLRLSRFIKTPVVAVQVPVAAGGFDLTDKRFVAALKARNIKLHYWTINESAQMDALIKVGADGLLTDYVARGQAATGRAMPVQPAPMPSRP